VQFCFQQAQQVASGWQFPLVLGQVASKLLQHGWQGYCLRQYALACWQSRSEEECGAAYLQPFVKLHGLRLKLLAGAVAGCGARGAAMRTQPKAATEAAAAAAGRQGMDASDGAGVLDELLGVLQLVGQWCFEPAVYAQLQPLLQQLAQQQQQQVRPSVGEQDAALQQLQQLLQEPLAPRQLLEQLQQQQQQAAEQQVQQQQGVEHQLQVWRLAVELLVQDSSNALLECQACYMDPLAPARYSLARGLYILGRCALIFCCCFCMSAYSACGVWMIPVYCGEREAAQVRCLFNASAPLICCTAGVPGVLLVVLRPTGSCTLWLGQGAVHSWQVRNSHLQLIYMLTCSSVVYGCVSGRTVQRQHSCKRSCLVNATVPARYGLAKGLRTLGRFVTQLIFTVVLPACSACVVGASASQVYYAVSAQGQPLMLAQCSCASSHQTVLRTKQVAASDLLPAVQA
jgi:hypothetical protein